MAGTTVDADGGDPIERGPRREGPEGELPPDPWAGLAEPLPPPVPHDVAGADAAPRGWPAERGATDRHAAGPNPAHPAGRATSDGSSAWYARSGVWIAVSVLALLALVVAAMDRPPSPPPSPTPGSVSTAPAAPADLAA